MSRGHGRMQRYLVGTVIRHGKPISFGELRDYAIDPQIGFLSFSEERSLRRTLQGLVSDKTLIALGRGGRADPHRYSINPFVALLAGDNAGFEAWSAAISGQAQSRPTS